MITLKNMFCDYGELSRDYVDNSPVLKSNEITFDSYNLETPDFIRFIIPLIDHYIKLEVNDPSLKFIVSNLKLNPGAKIKYHTHTNDSEFYFIFYSDGSIEVRYCKKGKGHELENDTDEILEVLSVKLVDSK